MLGDPCPVGHFDGRFYWEPGQDIHFFTFHDGSRVENYEDSGKRCKWCGAHEHERAALARREARDLTWEDCICLHGNAVDPGCPYCNRREARDE